MILFSFVTIFLILTKNHYKIKNMEKKATTKKNTEKKQMTLLQAIGARGGTVERL